jgi:citrate synthase
LTRYLTADEAIRVLKIRRQTLYAYVSRGLIQAEGGEGDSRRSVYRADDVEALLARKRRGRTPAKAAETALDWGLPVLESALTLVEHGRLYYRGQDAVALAQSGATLEDVAQLLWAVRAGFDPFASPPPGSAPGASGPPLSRCLDLLARRTAHGTPAWPADRDRKHMAAADLVRAIAGVLGGYDPDANPIHERLARAWGVDGQVADLIRMALVLCADHEFNASAFTVRCIASTGASLDAAVAGGIAALSGPRHGGATAWVTALIREAERTDPDEAVAGWLARGETYLPGFGHPLYPDGDPRGRAILERLGESHALVQAVAAIGGPPPNLDFALVALQHRHDLPKEAPFILFAAGRTVGWLAHAMEQQETGTLIRPRARYVGPAADAP